MTAAAGPADSTGQVLRVVVVDDQALVRSGFSMILGVEPDLEVVGEASDGATAVEVVARLTPDVVLMDVQMPGTDGIEATRTIVARDLAKVIILTTFDRDDYLVDGLRADHEPIGLGFECFDRPSSEVHAHGVLHGSVTPV